MQVSRLTVAKYVFFGCAVIGLVGWNVHLQNNLHEERIASRSQVEARDKRSASQVNQQSPGGGALFIRWGRTTCPDDDSELVYAGIAGGSLHTDTGGGSEYLCLARDVQFGNNPTAKVDVAARIHGAELEVGSMGVFSERNSAPSALHNSDVTCTVCRSKYHSTQMMIPGRKECYPGWKRQYWGYLMTEHYTHHAWHTYACVDEAPEAEEKGHRNDNGALMYHVQGICGSLPCPHYVNGFELTCVVCTK